MCKQAQCQAPSPPTMKSLVSPLLHEFVTANRSEIIRRCRTKVAARSPTHPGAEIAYGVPVFLDQLVEALRLNLASSPEIGLTALQHGRDLLRRGFTVSQVVHDY